MLQPFLGFDLALDTLFRGLNLLLHFLLFGDAPNLAVPALTEADQVLGNGAVDCLVQIAFDHVRRKSFSLWHITRIENFVLPTRKRRDNEDQPGLIRIVLLAVIDAAQNPVRLEVLLHLLDQNLFDWRSHANLEDHLMLHDAENLSFLYEHQGRHVDELRSVVREEDALAHLVLPKSLHVLEVQLLYDVLVLLGRHLLTVL